MRKKNLALIPPDEIIQGKIYLIRGEKIMLDENLALLYHVEINRNRICNLEVTNCDLK